MSSDFSEHVSDFFDNLAEPYALLALFDFLPDAYLFVKDAQSRFVKVNQALVRARGLKSEAEILGKTDIHIHPRYWALRYMEEDQKVIRSRERLVDQVWLVPNAEGRLESNLSTKIPLFNRQQECIGIAGVRRLLDHSGADHRSERTGINAAVRAMTEQYAEPIEIKQLAHIADLSHSQFNRRFRARYRMSPSAYLQRVRVHEASRRLSDGDQSASETRSCRRQSG